jgi:imidazole glycerol-phosphate synthase subunit HisH
LSAVAIVDSGGANIASLRYALDRLGAASELTSNAATLRRAERVILPGVGSAGDAMSRLRALDLDRVIPALDQPVLGICLGMQLLFEFSEEAQGSAPTQCLGILGATVRRMAAAADRPVPHMGWNRLRFGPGATLLAGLDDGVHMYFVHSYAAPPGPWSLATASYGDPFSAVVQQRNFFGCQFHPERSAANGSRLLANFLQLRRCA